MKRIKEFEKFDRMNIFGKTRRAVDDSDELKNELPDPAGFDLDFKRDKMAEEVNELVEDLENDIRDTFEEYYTKIINVDPGLDRNDVITYLANQLKKQ